MHFDVILESMPPLAIGSCRRQRDGQDALSLLSYFDSFLKEKHTRADSDTD